MTTDTLALALAQLNPTVGDVAGNLDKARRARAQAAGADIVVFTELFLAGYPPEDLVLKPAFQAACRAAMETLARETADGGRLWDNWSWFNAVYGTHFGLKMTIPALEIEPAPLYADRGQRLAGQTVEFGLGIEQVHLTGPAILHEHNDGLSLRWEMRRLRIQINARLREIVRTPMFAMHHARERNSTKTHAAGLQ